MKKKDLLQDWEIVQQEYYEQFNRSEVEEIYNDWFIENPDRYASLYDNKDELIAELIKNELIYRQDDTIEELKETITYLEKLNFNN
jgi:hypothetical protein